MKFTKLKTIKVYTQKGESCLQSYNWTCCSIFRKNSSDDAAMYMLSRIAFKTSSPWLSNKNRKGYNKTTKQQYERDYICI